MSKDRVVNDSIFLTFTTRAFSTGIPTTLLGSPLVEVYINNIVTPLTAGIVLSIDHNGRVGFNMVTINATTALGYVASRDYHLVIAAGTVDSVSVVGEVVASFSIEHNASFLRLGAPAAVSVSNDIAAIKAQTDTILIDTQDIQPKIGNPAGSSLSFDIAAIKTETASIKIDTGTNIPGQITGLNDIAANEIVSNGAINTLAGAVLNVTNVNTTAINTDMRGTDGANTLAPDNTSIATILSNTDGIIQKIGTPAGLDMSSDIAAVKTETALIKTDTTDILADTSDIQPKIGAPVTDISADLASVKADTMALQGDWVDGGRLDVLLDRLITQIDTPITEPGQGVPPVSAKMGLKVDYIYKFLRNRSTSTATNISVLSDNGVTVDHKANHSDDGTTYDRGEWSTGP